jgi:hypothetical protein
VNISDVIVISEPIECGNECNAIVCDNFLYGSPSIQDVFEYECSEGAGSLNIKGMPLGPGREGALHLYNVIETGNRQHQHGVNVCLAKEGCRGGNYWEDMKFGGLMELALMASGDILFDIISKRWPPESVKEGA